MIRFRALGTVDLRDADGREMLTALRRPKLVALLGYLAAARPGAFHRRDTLLALLWPELDTAHARNALRQAVYELRSLLGPEVVLARGNEELSVDDRHLWADVRAFRAALDAGNGEEALALYAGPLLSGVHIADAPDFERWLEDERAHLWRRAREGAERLIAREEVAHNAVEAVRWARRLTELAPEDEGAVRKLIQLLDRAGDRAGAIRTYEDFERRLHRDLELEPSAQTQALALEIRARRAAALRIPSLASAPASASDPASPEVAAVHPRPRPRMRVGLTLSIPVIVALLSAGWFLLSAARRAHGTLREVAPTPIAILPFTNLGPADQEYFADGVTEEIAARLAAVDRLRVIGRTSASRYKRTEKSIPEIGNELGVRYALEGSVRWERAPQGQGRVRVTSRLVRTTDGTHVWAEIYDEPVDEIFRVQSDIAQKVVRALGVILLDRQRHTLDAVPTRNVEAYDYYLRGTDYMMHRGLEPRYAYAAVQMYEKAVQLDPGFTLAWARLARINARIYWFYYDRSGDRLARARRAIDRAVELQPDLPEVHLALGAYYWMCHLDYDRALGEFALAEAGLPNETDLLVPRAVLRSRQGDFQGGFEDYARALQLDPGSASIAQNYAADLSFHRAYARAESLYDRAIVLEPDRNEPYFEKASNYARWEGDTRKARAILEQVQAIGVTDAPTLLWQLYRIDLLDRRYEDAVRRLSAGFPEFINWHFRFIARAQLYADAYALMRRHDLARAYYDSARILASRRLQGGPDDPRLHSALGIAYAGLGRKRDAIEEGRRGVELLPVGKEAQKGYYGESDLARIYTMVGEHDAAIDRLEHLLSIPGDLTPAWLRIDPSWDPLRQHPRFQALIARGR